MMMEALRSSETSVLTRATPRYIPEDGILHSHRRVNLKSYISKFSLIFFVIQLTYIPETIYNFIYQLIQIRNWARQLEVRTRDDNV
jgi:hypothetical protein